MHRLNSVLIENFRCCRHVSFSLSDFTPVVGYNNAGKSTILTAIEWLISPTALSSTDFNSPNEPVIVAGTVEGVSAELISKMPDNQRKQITPFVEDGVLRFRRRMESPGSATTAKVEVRNPSISDDTETNAWEKNPTGIPQALKTLFPESIRVHAMQDAADDVGKQTRSNTIGKLIADVIEPVRKKHEGELKEALKAVGNRFSADGNGRSEELKRFDDEATGNLSDLFPGLQLRLDVPLPEIPDLFKNGTVQVLERFGETTTTRSFSTVGHGAQRCIQMALIRYLSEKKVAASDVKRKLLLIDEPELYLHPQGVEQVRNALKELSTERFQVVFTTHSPLMLHRDNAPEAVVVRKPSHSTGTVANKPLARAVKSAIEDAGHAARVLFELGNAAQVYFSDQVLLNEGKTERALLPLLYESHFGQTPSADRTGLISMNGSGNFHNARAALEAMEINVKVLADLDYFCSTGVSKITGKEAELESARKVLLRLQKEHGFTLDEGGLPKKDKTGMWTAAKVWALFAADDEGAELAKAEHERLKKHGIWVWKEGTIEDALNITDKGESIIRDLEMSIPKIESGNLASEYAAVGEMLDWLAD